VAVEFNVARSKSGGTGERNIAHVFMMTGDTGWLNGCVVVDDKGFIKTGLDLSPEELTAASWPLARRPYLLETSLPGIFATGDVSAGNVKRVASLSGRGRSRSRLFPNG